MNKYLVYKLLLMCFFFSCIYSRDKEHLNINMCKKKVSTIRLPTNLDTVVDANYKLNEVFNGKLIPLEVIKSQSLITVYYIGYDSLLHKGQIIVNNSVAESVISIFDSLHKIKFPIEKVIPINHYCWDDDLSMLDNNTSSFNYRLIKNSSKLSVHSQGLAIDINPRANPYISRTGKVFPKNGDYNLKNKGTIVNTGECVKIFKYFGWKWGGNWKYSKDFQHFSINGR